MEVYIDSITTLIPPQFEHVRSLVRDQAVAAGLVEDGFSQIPISDLDTIAMARIVIERCLGTDPSPANFDAVVFGTESYDQDDRETISSRKYAGYRKRLKAMLAEQSGTAMAPIFAVSMNGCANFTACLSVAYGFVKSGLHRKILVILSDRVGGRTRVLANGTGILGDAASCFVVSSEGRLRIECITAHAIPTETTQHGIELLRACKRLRQSYFSMLKTPLAEIDRLYGDNLLRPLYQIVSEGLSVPPSLVSNPWKPLTGHAFASDCPIAIEADLKSGTFRSGETIGAINLGSSLVGLIALRYR